MVTCKSYSSTIRTPLYSTLIIISFCKSVCFFGGHIKKIKMCFSFIILVAAYILFKFITIYYIRFVSFFTRCVLIILYG